MKSCLMVLNPRDIPECLMSIRALPIDKVWFRGYTEAELTEPIRKFIEETATSPVEFDGYYVSWCNGQCNGNPELGNGGNNNAPTGTFVGTAINGGLSNLDMCTIQAGGEGTVNPGSFMVALQDGSLGQCTFVSGSGPPTEWMWADYNTNFVLPATIGNTWLAQGNHTFLDTTGGHTHNVDYIQSTGGNIYAPSDFNWLLILPVALLAFIVGKKL